MFLQRARCLRKIVPRYQSCNYRISQAAFSTSQRRHGYDDTIQNLKIGSHTGVLYQGFTGRQATLNAQESIEWGTNVVGGVKPKVYGDHLDRPVFPTVKAALEKLKVDATGIYIPAHQALRAIEEAIEAEIPLIVTVAEHIPLHDIMKIHSMLNTQSKSRLVGANAPGIISAIGRCRVGFQPLAMFSPGHVGVVAKSGTLSYETVGSLTKAGVGQSLCIGVGGDVIAGTSFIDALRVFETDDDTDAIIMVGELGGTAEEDAAEWIKDYNKRTKNPKPIAAVIGGFQAPPGRIMGHAGAWTGMGEGTAESKYKALERAGVTMVDHPTKFGTVMKDILTSSGGRIKASDIPKVPGQQSRSYHTPSSRHRPSRSNGSSVSLQQRRFLRLPRGQSSDLLQKYNINLSSSPLDHKSSHYVGISPSRSDRSPSIIAAPTADPEQLPHRVKRFPFDYRRGPTSDTIDAAVEYLQLDAAPPLARARVVELIENIWRLYREKEAIDAHVSIAVPEDQDDIQIYDPYLFFDDAAFKISKRQADIHKDRDRSNMSSVDLKAEKANVIYIPLLSPTTGNGVTGDAEQPKNLVGTLVNGAGLAMNTNDIVHDRLFPSTTCSNFLDTGGKATANSIKASFQLILSDRRVSVVFVNIFGGLTLCDMIAEGIILAFKEVGVNKPVVVRLKGTNEERGRTVLAEANLPIHAFDDFDEAVQKVGELANADQTGES